MTAGTAATRVMASVASDMRDAWRESGACANYHARASVSETDDNLTACADCGIAGLAHQLLRWAQLLERAAKETT